MSRHTVLVQSDLRLKHQLMAEAIFPFFRATYYRWAQLWPEVCPDLAKAPHVLAVGDLHVENFGTWRDIEGRLVWGVNDFDEASVLAYTNDLVRLAVSLELAAQVGHLTLSPKAACAAIFEGYRQALAHGGRPFILEEDHKWLRHSVTGEMRNPVNFWKKMQALPLLRDQLSISAQEALEHVMPESGLTFRVVRRVAGLGSLGHQRLVAIANCRGSKIAREAKALVPSAVHWAHGEKGPAEIMYQAIVNRAVRSPDPFVQLRGRWIVRRLSPSCCRVELISLPADRDELKLLFSMGWETANIHLGSTPLLKVRRHAAKLNANWLLAAAKQMVKAVDQDWRAWRKSQSRKT